MKEYADDNFKFKGNGRKLSERKENTVGKGEIAYYKQFLLSPQCFQKTLWQTCRIQGLFGKGLTDSPLRFITLPPQFLSKVPRVLKPSYYEAFDLDRLSQR